MPHPARPRRSALYMPASNPRAVEKARSLACDVRIWWHRHVRRLGNPYLRPRVRR